MQNIEKAAPNRLLPPAAKPHSEFPASVPKFRLWGASPRAHAVTQGSSRWVEELAGIYKDLRYSHRNGPINSTPITVAKATHGGLEVALRQENPTSSLHTYFLATCGFYDSFTPATHFPGEGGSFYPDSSYVQIF